MKKADVVIGAGGSTVWEYLYFQLPSFIVVTAENQLKSIQDLAEKNSIVYLGNHCALKSRDYKTVIMQLLKEQSVIEINNILNAEKVKEKLVVKEIKNMMKIEL